MKFLTYTSLILAFLLLIVPGCRAPGGGTGEEKQTQETGELQFIPPAEGYPVESALLCTIYFYTGDNVGDRAKSTGPQLSTDGGRTWNPMAWHTIITSGIDVCPYGKYVYCACGNGVLASSDGGRNWKLSGGWRMTEIQDVAIGPESPFVVWAAGAYGLYLSEDGANTWTQPGNPQPFRYVDTVMPDRDDPNHVLVGTELGLFATSDRGLTYQKIGPQAPVRSILQDGRDAKIFWVGTDGDGLWRSGDGGATWTKLENSPGIVNRVIQDPGEPSEILLGIGHGVGISHDDGETWETYTHGFGDFSPVYALLVDKSTPNLIYAGARDGLYVSDDGGVNWFQFIAENDEIVLRNAVIFDLWQGDLYRGEEEPPSDEPGTLTVNGEMPPGEEHREAYSAGFDERARAAAELLAGNGEEQLASLEEGRHVGLFEAMAMIREGRASEALWGDLRAYFSDFGHSMFDSFPAISFYLYCEDRIPDDIKTLIRDGLVKNDIYRGDTENHWLMYYTSLLLTAQTWPESSAREWYTGRTTQENYDEALGWLNEWTRITTTIGQGEFDSPHYYNTYMAPNLLLYQFAQDSKLKRQAGMMIDLLLADMGAESLKGRYCGGHSRMYDSTVVMGDHDTSTGYYYLYFGGVNLPDDFASWLGNGIYNSYRCPIVIATIATWRQVPFVHTEVKRVRNQMRYSDLLNSPVYKYTYMAPQFCLGSLQGGILQPIQQHTWDITWIGSAENTTLFSLHPYYSAYELAMFFPEDPHMLTASVQAQKSTYTDPNKLNSSSPYERIFQYQGTLLAVYNVPEGTTHPRVTLYVPACLNREIDGGWIFGHDGDMWVGVFPLTDGQWISEPNPDFPPAHRLIVPAGQTGFAVETGSIYFQETYDQFKTLVRAMGRPQLVEDAGGPTVRYTDHRGNTLEYHWADDRRVLNGSDWIFPSDMLYSSLMMHATVNARIIEIQSAQMTRTLDFNRLAITEISTIPGAE